ncbi:MAG: hypothetical protein EAZ30_12440 [Betaproteobacteria bacterium]|nr:MAG: hypothetical protein EAZ30_12440 [Betaproteobacteria bacterium]
MLDRRSALLRIAVVAGAPIFSGCAELSPGYPERDTPREAAMAWPADKPRTALVLGSGGPRGFAHVGVLKVLAAAGIEPTLVVGSSAGAIMGALYAARVPIDVIEQRALSLGLTDIADPALLKPNRLIGRALQNVVNDMVGGRRIEDLPLRFCAVAVPVGATKLVAFSAGDTGAAVRASSALPSIFLPTQIGDTLFEDGDLVSPVPVDVARALGATRIVAVDVSAWREDEPANGHESWKRRDAERRAIIEREAVGATYFHRVRLPYYAGASRAYREDVIGLAAEQTKVALESIRAALA